MASEEEVSEAVEAAHGAGAIQMVLLKCTSAYPAPAEEANLLTIPELARRFSCPVGLSDHTMGIAVPVAAVALGACILEKHLCLRRADGGPDAAFSLEPEEFKAMVDAVRTAEKALGSVQFACGPREANSLKFRRSLFVVEDVKKGDLFTKQNVRSIRPADGLHPRHLNEVLGKRAACDVERGTPLSQVSGLRCQVSGVRKSPNPWNLRSDTRHLRLCEFSFSIPTMTSTAIGRAGSGMLSSTLDEPQNLFMTRGAPNWAVRSSAFSIWPSKLRTCRLGVPCLRSAWDALWIALASTGGT
jgi:hypothetical protein